MLDAAAVAALTRSLRGPGCVIVKHTNPCGAAERPTLLAAWEAALAGDPVSAFGGVVGLTGPVDAALAEALSSIFLEVVVAPAFEPAALERPVGQAEPPARRRPVARRDVRRGARGPGRPDPIRWARSGPPAAPSSSRPQTPPRTIRRAGPSPRRAVRRRPSRATSTSPGGSSGASRATASSWSRTGGSSGSARARRAGSTPPARRWSERGRSQARSRPIGAACGSDAFFPFPDAVEACLAAGVTAFAQPGGSVRDADVVAVAEAAGATMVLTGVRHFRH